MDCLRGLECMFCLNGPLPEGRNVGIPSLETLPQVYAWPFDGTNPIQGMLETEQTSQVQGFNPNTKK